MNSPIIKKQDIPLRQMLSEKPIKPKRDLSLNYYRFTNELNFEDGNPSLGLNAIILLPLI